MLDEIRQSFVGIPVWLSDYLPGEPVGVDALADFAAAAYGADDPLALPEGDGPMTVRRTRTGATLRIALPFADKSDIDLARHGDELVVTVGSYRRLLSLPAALARHAVAGARVEDGSLQVRFRPPGPPQRRGDAVTDEHGERHEPVGSVAEEAARLLGALQGWAGAGAPGEGPAGGAGLLGSRSTSTSPPATPSAATARCAR